MYVIESELLNNGFPYIVKILLYLKEIGSVIGIKKLSCEVDMSYQNCKEYLLFLEELELIKKERWKKEKNYSVISLTSYGIAVSDAISELLKIEHEMTKDEKLIHS